MHFGARDYDPETGRWITKDPILFMGNGINVDRVLEGDVNAGLGIDGGLTTQGPFSSSPGPNDSVSGATGFPTNSYKAGVGVGAEASIGVTQVTTIAIPIIPSSWLSH